MSLSLPTHIDKKHIHNHIIFNNVNIVTSKCYQSNKKSYHQIRYQSDKLCKENNLSVINEHYESFKKKYKVNGKSWYEIKYGKHIVFKSKDKPRFTRAKTIGEDYTEERLKERIAEREMIKAPIIKKRIGNIIDMKPNVKVKESKGYEYWAMKHNLNTMAESVIFIREHGIKSVQQLDEYI